MGLQEEDHRGRVPFSLPSIKGTVKVTLDVDLDRLAEVIIVRFLPPTPFHTVLSRRKSLSTAHADRVGTDEHFLEGSIWYYFYK